uniref:Uncharacterized protein n=1 Tax=Steinernema glaseri TaxID=37863 RepID=A0A1I8AWX1_9BILA
MAELSMRVRSRPGMCGYPIIRYPHVRYPGVFGFRISEIRYPKRKSNIRDPLSVIRETARISDNPLKFISKFRLIILTALTMDLSVDGASDAQHPRLAAKDQCFLLDVL